MVSSEDFDVKMKKYNDSLFVERLVREAEAYGWEGDYIEIMSFVNHIQKKYGMPITQEFYVSTDA